MIPKVDIPLAAILATSALATMMAAVPQDTLQVDVNLVNIFVTVQDAQGLFVDDLEAGDFRVIEDGRPQPIEVFESHQDLATGLGILVDNSGSSSEILRSVRGDVPDFVEDLPGGDEAFVVAFGTNLELVYDFGEESDAIGRALDRLRPYGTSVLFDALYTSIEKISESRHERQALIVLTDGNDNRSVTTYTEVVGAAESGMVILYFVGIGPSALVDTYTLRGLAAKTGGSLIMLGREREVGDALEEIRDDLGRQYYIGYHASAEPGYHTIEVQVPERDNVTVRAREGYRVDGLDGVDGVDGVD
jgi:VWFA-related protein